jgi:hypothetical protein
MQRHTSARPQLAYYDDDKDGIDAHVVDLNTTNCSNACDFSGFKRAYIAVTDKDLYAMALSAKMNGGSFAVAFETGVTGKGNTTHGSPTCRINSSS